MFAAVLLDVDDVLDTTDALWAARSKDSSRVSRLTLRKYRVSYLFQGQR